MPRAGLTTDRVVARAADLADRTGFDSLALGALAEDLGVRVPSLYKHVGGLPDLRRRVALAGLRDLHVILARAVSGQSGPAALAALADAYRRYAHTHPGRYTAALRAPTADDQEMRAVSDSLTTLLLGLMGDVGRHDDDAVHAARAVRSALHGFVALETAGGFGLPHDLDISYRTLVATLDAGLRATTAPPC
jgi:AcrR family transcriptional regulator